MAKIRLSGASLQDITVGTDGITKIGFSVPWRESTRKAGKWQELPDTVSGNIKLLPAKLAATHIDFTPRDFESHAIDFDVTEITGCHVFVPTDEKKSRELRFVVKTTALNADKKTLQLLRTAGDAAGALNISVESDAQSTIDDAQQTLNTPAE